MQEHTPVQTESHSKTKCPVIY